MGPTQLVVAIAAGVLVVLVAVIAVRRLVLARAGGFNVIWRRLPAVGTHGWSLGQARYRRDRLGVYRSLSPLPGASLTFRRSSLMLGMMRSPDESEAGVLPPDVVIVSGSSGGTAFEMALSMSAVTTLRSWVESRPPGSARAATDVPQAGRGPADSPHTDE